jgi:hypothetical protein
MGMAPVSSNKAPHDDTGCDVKLLRTTMSHMRAELTGRQIRILAQVLECNAIEPGRYPASSGPSSIRAGWSTAWLEDIDTRDAWGNDLLYCSDGTNYLIASLGADRSPEFDYSRFCSAYALLPGSKTSNSSSEHDIVLLNGQELRPAKF